MSGPAPQPQWYLARDGKQHGPISEAELTAFIEQGHLQPTDLLWRDGFPEWRPAMVVFPPRGAGAPRGGPTRQRPAASTLHPARQPYDPTERPQATYRDEPIADRRRPGRVIAVLLLVAALVGGGWFAYAYSSRLSELFNSLTASSGVVSIADRKSLEASPLVGFRGGTAATIDTNLQATALWRVIKREFPDWYTQRVGEAAVLAGNKKDDAAIGLHMATKLRELRRQQVANAISATLPRLTAVAQAFHESLVQLGKHSVEACHAFISQGEASPAIVALLQGTEHTVHLQAQLTAMFEAIAEGRKQAGVYPHPNQSNFNVLVAGLRKLGWTEKDIELFSDDRAFADAPPQTKCRMVQDWFSAQLALGDAEARERLLVHSVRLAFAR